MLSILEAGLSRRSKKFPDMGHKEEILKIIDENYPEIAVMLIKELLTEDKNAFNMGKIMRVLNVFETGSLTQDYSSIFIMADGPNKIKQITLGKGLTEFGNLSKLIENYAEADGEFSEDLKPYVGRIGKRPSLHSDSSLKRILKEAGSDPVMREEQDKIFAEKYWIPAKDFFDKNGFKEALSMLVIADSTLHSGSIPSWLRKRFAEKPPASGGSERKWIEEYVRVRHDWLWSKGGLLRNTTYRTNCFKDIIKRGDWDLSEPINANGIIVN